MAKCGVIMNGSSLGSSGAMLADGLGRVKRRVGGLKLGEKNGEAGHQGVENARQMSESLTSELRVAPGFTAGQLHYMIIGTKREPADDLEERA